MAKDNLLRWNSVNSDHQKVKNPGEFSEGQ